MDIPAWLQTCLPFLCFWGILASGLITLLLINSARSPYTPKEDK